MAEIDLNDLADRVEKLEGPNYAIEVEIFKALHPEYADYVQGRGGLVHPYDGSDQRVLSDVRPGNYTASIDTALRLSPEGWRLYAVDASIDGRFYASLRGPIIDCNDPDREGIIGVPSMAAGCANSLALALTAAALRARLMEGEGEK